LTDVLELVGIPKLMSTTKFGGKYVEFVSIDQCKVMTIAWNCNSEISDSFILLISSMNITLLFIGGKWRSIQGIYYTQSSYKS
jgi:hypothetical protein